MPPPLLQGSHSRHVVIMDSKEQERMVTFSEILEILLILSFIDMNLVKKWLVSWQTDIRLSCCVKGDMSLQNRDGEGRGKIKAVHVL
jgi:hypothetical protein